MGVVVANSYSEFYCRLSFSEPGDHFPRVAYTACLVYFHLFALNEWAHLSLSFIYNEIFCFSGRHHVNFNYFQESLSFNHSRVFGGAFSLTMEGLQRKAFTIFVSRV